jgi:CheY-like chemotaxis protein
VSTCIAVIDDDAACRELLHDLLSEEGYAVHLFADSATAARCLRDVAPAAIILDMRLENPTAGWEVLADLRLDPVLHATPVLVCSADLSTLQQRRRSGAAGVRDPGQTVRRRRLACPAATPGAWCALGLSYRHGCREMSACLCGRLTAVAAPAPGTPCCMRVGVRRQTAARLEARLTRRRYEDAR